MFTRCPQCKTVHPLNAAVITRTRGLVQCGRCQRVFSALSFLYDEWPSGQAYGPAKGANTAPPVIGAIPAEQAVAEDNLPVTGEPGEPGTRAMQLGWIMAMVFLTLLTIVNAAWTFREPLGEIPLVNDWLQQSGWLQVEQDGLLKDPQQFQLVSRDLHSHPTRAGILVLNLTFVNLAQHSQVFPVLELTLLDAANQAVARRRLQPADYLRPDADIKAGLAADVYLPVLLELGDPGNQAIGFEINFL
jgi:predicted Zn finger-like uncharacterized protein